MLPFGNTKHTLITMEIKDKIEQFLNVAMSFLCSEDLMPTRNIIANYKSRLEKPMQVAIIGKIKASKSTLVNAILGSDNVVQTGGMELTYNVSWLKYSEFDKSAKVYFKDGRRERAISKDEWTVWANAYAEDDIKNNISYMEISFDNPMLKQINIIDTPGLLSGGIDAQNTIDFLSKEENKPDAIVVLFAGALHEEIAKVIDSFQNSNEQNLSFTPLNTIGVLSKIDLEWKPFQSMEQPLDKAKQTCKRVLNDPNTNSLFYNIYPLNSLLSIASFSITEQDIELIKRLSNRSLGELEGSLMIINDFISDIDSSELSFAPCRTYKKGMCYKDGCNTPCKVDFKQNIDFSRDIECIRRYLYMKFDRFGIMLISKFIADNPTANVSDVKMYLREQSGFNQFFRVLNNHFGQRAMLIKMQSAISNLLSELSKESTRLKQNEKNDTAIIIDQIQNSLIEELRKDTEFKLYEILVSLYDGKLTKLNRYLYEFCYTQEELENDIKCLAGENGLAYAARLGFSETVSVNKLLEEIELKINKWQNISYEYHENAVESYYYDYAKIMYTAYYELGKQISLTAEKVEEYKKIMEL